MPVMVRWDTPHVDRARYDAIRADVDWDSTPPKGALLHSVGFDDRGAHATDIWASRDDFDAYLADRYGPALRKVVTAEVEPDVVEIAVLVASPDMEGFFLRAVSSA